MNVNQMLQWYNNQPDVAALENRIKELEKDNQGRKRYISWGNAKNNNIYISEAVNDTLNPHYDELVIDGRDLKLRNYLREKQAKGEVSSADIDRMQVGIIKPEFQNDASELADFLNAKRAGRVEVAGTLLPNSFSKIANVMANANVITWRNDEYVLEQGWDTVREDKIKVTLDDLLPFYADSDIGIMNIPEAKTHDYSRNTFFLKKGGARIEWTKWLNMGIWDHDVKADASGILTTDFPRLRNAELAAGMTGFGTSGATGAYDALTAANYHYDTDPRKDFVTLFTTIRTNGGIPNLYLMNDKTFVLVFGNSFLRTGGELGEPAPVEVGPRVVTHPMLRNSRIVIDPILPNQIIYIGDQRAFVSILGPTSTRDYDFNDKYVAGSIAEIWYSSGTRNANLVKQITGATS